MENLTVIKIGGNIVDNHEKLDIFLSQLATIDGSKILIHGGGKIATQVSKSLGFEAKMIAGRRVTDKETIKVVTMVYAGLVNKTIVAKLQSLNKNAIGLSGADGNVIKAHKRLVKESSIDYGYVGDIDTVDADFLKNLLDQQRLPVLAPITHDGQGQLLNTNADTIASETAIALSKFYNVSLLYAFELPGVMKDIKDKSSIISEITSVNYKALLTNGTIAEGMIPKMDNCYNAITKGVKEVLIGDALELKTLLSTDRTSGTKLIA